MKNDFQNHEYDICIVSKGNIYGFNSKQKKVNGNVVKIIRIKRGKEWENIYYGEIDSKNEIVEQMARNLSRDEIAILSSMINGSIAVRDFNFYLQQTSVKQDVAHAR